jgi:peptide/nickel transport system substrate-binding protein
VFEYLARIASPRRLISTVTLVSLLLAAGCGGGSSESGKKPTISKELLAPAPDQPKPDRGLVSIAMPGKVTTTDPLMNITLTDAIVTHLVGGTLYAFAADGKSTKPALATSGEYASDHKSFTAKIDPKAAFSDGTPLTSADVVATFKRGKASKTNVYAAQFVAIEAVTAVDKSTVLFKFNRPYLSFETFLAYPDMSILKASEISDSGGLPANPTMAGPYFAEGTDVKSNKYSLTRNERYPERLQPAIGKLDFRVVTDPNGRQQQLVGGNVDFSVSLSAKQLKSLPKDFLRVVTPANLFMFLGMNNKQPVLKDPQVRKAISKALNREQINAIAWGGMSTPIADFFPTIMQGYRKDSVAPDPAAAKKLLAGTACEDGCKLRILLDNANTDWAQPAAVVIQQQLKPLGIDVAVQTLDSPTANQRLGEGQYDMTVNYFGDQTDVPEGLPAYCIASAGGLAACQTGYSSKDADSAYDAATRATDDAQLDAAYDKINDVFARDQPFATLTDHLWTAGLAGELSGYLTLMPTAFIEIAPLQS